MVKLLVCDVDGTLLPKGENNLSADIKQALSNAISHGTRVAIASGRSLENLEAMFCDFSEELFFISHDGALTTKNGNTLFHRAIPNDILKQTYMFYKNCECIAFYSEKKCYVTGNDSKFIQSDNIIKINTLFDIKEQILKIGIYGNDATNTPYLTNGIRLCSLSDGCREYVSSLAEKGIALSDLQMRLFLTKFDTAAIGNYFNDIKMLKNAKYSAAMHTSPTEVKNAANHIANNAADFINNIIK